MKFRIHTTERKIVITAETANDARRYAMKLLNENERIVKVKAVK